ncbi:unnamed protein product [Microthlaspi erraticum]|uniref:Uncharacterized protein n=1 Tax=Microthlaspi erraticum TaxID=1685480 RepID=A0A6D2JAH6_9BRAS|nr:unnamed protein product [Microthlaspi erraticum]
MPPLSTSISCWWDKKVVRILYQCYCDTFVHIHAFWTVNPNAVYPVVLVEWDNKLAHVRSTCHCGGYFDFSCDEEFGDSHGGQSLKLSFM